MSSFPDTPELFFNHVSKCAGMSIGTLLESAYPADTVLTSRLVSAAVIRTISDDELTRHRLIWGHFTDLARRRSPGRYNVVTLRDPWNRFRSILRHALRERGEQWTNFRAVEPYADSLDPRDLETDEFKKTVGKLHSYTHLSPLTPNNNRATPHQRADEAIASLDAYDLIVTDETIDTCVAYLADMLGLPPIEASPRRNAATAWPDSLRADPPREYEPLLVETHDLDKEFYAIARERSLEQVAAIRCPFEDRERRHRERLEATSTALEWTLNWAGPVRAGGWSARVPPGIIRASDSDTLCQHAATEAFIDIPVACRSGLDIETRVSAPLGIQSALEITIDGHGVMWKHSRSMFDPFEVTWRMETTAAAGARGIRIAFRLPESTTNPQDLPWLRALRARAT